MNSLLPSSFALRQLRRYPGFVIASFLILGHLLADTEVRISSGAQSVVMNFSLAALMAAFSIFAAAPAASWIPARRSASIEPMKTLRTKYGDY